MAEKQPHFPSPERQEISRLVNQYLRGPAATHLESLKDYLLHLCDASHGKPHLHAFSEQNHNGFTLIQDCLRLPRLWRNTPNDPPLYSPEKAAELTEALLEAATGGPWWRLLTNDQKKEAYAFEKGSLRDAALTSNPRVFAYMIDTAKELYDSHRELSHMFHRCGLLHAAVETGNRKVIRQVFGEAKSLLRPPEYASLIDQRYGPDYQTLMQSVARHLSGDDMKTVRFIAKEVLQMSGKDGYRYQLLHRTHRDDLNAVDIAAQRDSRISNFLFNEEVEKLDLPNIHAAAKRRMRTDYDKDRETISRRS